MMSTGKFGYSGAFSAERSTLLPNDAFAAPRPSDSVRLVRPMIESITLPACATARALEPAYLHRQDAPRRASDRFPSCPTP